MHKSRVDFLFWVTRLTFEIPLPGTYNKGSSMNRRPNMTKTAEKKSFFQTVCALAIPVALQSMLQPSFRMLCAACLRVRKARISAITPSSAAIKKIMMDCTIIISSLETPT